MNIQERIEKEWAQDTVADYNENTGYSFYTQSPLNQIKNIPIKLLVLGINPGSHDVKIEDWKVAPVWKDILGEEGMTSKKLMGGNPSFVSMIEKKKAGEKYKKWNFWEKLCQLLDIAGQKKLVDNFSDYVYTNIYLGSTKGEKDIPKDKYKKLKEHAFELINILQPECIICLGQKVMDSVLEHYEFKNDKTCQVPGLPIRYKLINGMQVFGFHHPAYYYSDAEKKLVGGFLGHYYKNTGITAVDPLPVGLELIKNNYLDYKANHIHGQSKGVFDYNKLIDLLRKKILSLDEKYKENDGCYRINAGKDMKITVSSTNEGTIAMRAATKDKNGSWVRPGMASLLEQLETLGWIEESKNTNIWFVKLDYKGKTEEEIRDIIIKTRDYLEDKEIDMA